VAEPLTAVPNMKLAILQPSYLPWLGYFDQMARCDRFLFLDDTQYTRRDWRNRNKIRTRDGWAWLTVPVRQKHHFTQSLLETRIDNSSDWRNRHRKAVQHSYAKAPYFDLYFPYLQSVWNREWDFLVDLCLETTLHLAKVLHIATPTQRSSEMPASGAKAEKILNLCKHMEATRYLTGDLARDYLCEEDFLRNGIQVEYHEYGHPTYTQRFSGFVPYLSVIDLLFNYGDESLKILLKDDAAGRD